MRNAGKVIKACGLSLIPKVKYEHIYLTSFSKMRVELAAQVIHLQIYDHIVLTCVFHIQMMSKTVAKAVNLMGGDEPMKTVKYIEMVDKLFDCMNVSSLCRGKLKRKPFAQPY